MSLQGKNYLFCRNGFIVYTCSRKFYNRFFFQSGALASPGDPTAKYSTQKKLGAG